MTHEERVWHHEMETLEGIHEHAERIASLEELVLDIVDHVKHGDGFGIDRGWMLDRMHELEVAE
jgi:hypothetical protein